jgi:hypothetical protein
MNECDLVLIDNKELIFVLFIKYFSVTKSRRMIWERKVARMAEKRDVGGGKLREDPVVDGRIILRWIFRKWDVGAWTGLSWLRIGSGGEDL